MPTKIQTYRLYSGTADASGDATATSSVQKGKILAVGLTYDASAGTGTDVQIDAKVGENTQTILDIDNSATDAVYYPRVAVESTTGSDLTFDGTQTIPTEFPVDGLVTITVAGATADNGVAAYIVMEVF